MTEEDLGSVPGSPGLVSGKIAARSERNLGLFSALETDSEGWQTKVWQASG